jgi:hypothetical protein
MKRILSAAIAIRSIVAFALPVAAMTWEGRGAEPTKSAEKKWGEAVEGQALSISSEKPAYAPGEAIVLDITFKNVGQKVVYHSLTHPMMIYDVDVTLPDGKPSPLTLYGEFGGDRRGSGTARTLKPGEDMSAQIDLTRHFDITLAGTYTVSLATRVWTDAGYTKLEAKSNKLEIPVDESLRPDSGAAGTEGANAAKRTWGTAVEGQAVSITTDKTAYDMGEPVTLGICFKNLGQQDVKAVRKDPLGTYLLTVLDPDGKPALRTLYGKEAIKADRAKNLEKLASGEVICDEIKLNRLFDLTLRGVYTVSVQRPVWKDGAISATLKATSNKLQIKK